MSTSEKNLFYVHDFMKKNNVEITNYILEKILKKII